MTKTRTINLIIQSLFSWPYLTSQNKPYLMWVNLVENLFMNFDDLDLILCHAKKLDLI